MSRVLITGARAPVALDLARHFGRAGFEVHLTDSVRFPLAGYSKFCAHYHRLPPPRQETESYSRAINELILSFDLVIPTCEDVMWLSQEAHGFCPDLSTLIPLHNKWLFNQKARDMGLGVPQTWRLHSRQEAEEVLRTRGPLVLKPVYSRFATHTLIKPNREQLPIFQGPWVAQDYWEGAPYCSFSVCQNGHLAAHVVYRPAVRLGQGAGVVVEAVDHPKIDSWVSKFCGELKLNGQFSFDFIETMGGDVACLECNPRTTSGVHLFPFDGSLAEAYFDTTQSCLTVEPGRRAMLTMPALFANPLAVFKLKPRAVAEEFDDWMPTFGQVVSFGETCAAAVGRGLLEATTHDIYWDRCES